MYGCIVLYVYVYVLIVNIHVLYVCMLCHSLNNMYLHTYIHAYIGTLFVIYFTRSSCT